MGKNKRTSTAKCLSIHNMNIISVEDVVVSYIRTPAVRYVDIHVECG